MINLFWKAGAGIVIFLVIRWFVWPLIGKFLGLVLFFIVVIALLSLGGKK